MSQWPDVQGLLTKEGENGSLKWVKWCVVHMWCVVLISGFVCVSGQFEKKMWHLLDIGLRGVYADVC